MVTSTSQINVDLPFDSISISMEDDHSVVINGQLLPDNFYMHKDGNFFTTNKTFIRFLDEEGNVQTELVFTNESTAKKVYQTLVELTQD
jgi:hypothetical protein